jgi:hypothetical protein
MDGSLGKYIVIFFCLGLAIIFYVKEHERKKLRRVALSLFQGGIYTSIILGIGWTFTRQLISVFGFNMNSEEIKEFSGTGVFYTLPIIAVAILLEIIDYILKRRKSPPDNAAD